MPSTDDDVVGDGQAGLRSEGSPERGGNVRRNKALAIGLAAVVVASAVSWWAGRQIRSPAEIAARTAPPNASIISVPVEKRALTSDVVVRGTVGYGSPQAVSLPKSALKPGSVILTAAPVKGTALSEGNFAMTVSGRPVFVLEGAQPAHRDLGPGAEGADVQQLESALARLGFDPGRVDGKYDGATARAVAAWYRAGGWAPFGPTGEQQQALRTAEADQYSVRAESVSAEEALAAARSTQALSTADVTNKSAALAVALGTQRVAQLQLDETRAAQPPPSAAQLAAAEAAVSAATGAVGAAQGDLAAANSAAAQAAVGVQLAGRKVSLSASRSATVGGEVNALAAKLGIQVPADEVLFFASFPIRIDNVTAKTGEELTGAFMTVSNSRLVVTGALSVKDAKLVHRGAAVTIQDPELGVRSTGTVTDIADTPGTQGVDPQRFYLQVTPADAPTSLVGASVALTITVGATEGEAIVVPVAALSVAADGASRVQVDRRNGRTRYVTVKPGLAAKGLVEVTPVRGHLVPGDLVVVGSGGGARARISGSAGR